MTDERLVELEELGQDIARRIDRQNVWGELVAEVRRLRTHIGDNLGGRINGLEAADWFKISVAKEQALDASCARVAKLEEELVAARATWGGWYKRPAHRLAWAELDALIAGDSRVDEVRAWSDSLTAIDAWKDRMRPHGLWPNPEQWHPDYITGDHERPGWAERIHAWRTVLAVLDDAITAPEAADADA